jgi:uncharacterized spore protein YtfJ
MERRKLMDTEVQAVFDALADLREKANVNAVFGEPVTVEGRTVIPVAKVAYGFGMGIGGTAVTEEAAAEEAAEKVAEEATGDGSGTGGVGGVLAHPLAVVEVTPEGTWVKPVVDEQKLALAGGLLGAWVAFWLARALVKILGQKA